MDFFAFAPFSLGERSCLGRRFAHIEIVTALAMIAKARHQDATHMHAWRSRAAWLPACPCLRWWSVMDDAWMLCPQAYRIEVPEGVTREQLLDTKVLLTLYPANHCKLRFKPRDQQQGPASSSSSSARDGLTDGLTA